MSMNNVYVIKQREQDGKWYGWDEMAEESTVDNGRRKLSFDHAPFKADSEHELRHMMDDSYWLSPEYGYTTDALPKDGTPIKFVGDR